MANYCSNCGAHMLPGNTKCFECGHVQVKEIVKSTESSSSSVGGISLVTGVIGLFIFGLPLGIVSIILGIKGIESGAGKAGLVLGIVDVIGVILFLGAM